MKYFLWLMILTIYTTQLWASSSFILSQNATEIAPDNWQNMSLEDDNVLGIETEKVYSTFLAPQNQVIVAVIDSGVDINHEDLQGKIWINPNEIPNNGIDDDGNGYIDDVVGWNFAGGSEGSGHIELRSDLPNGFIFHQGKPEHQVITLDYEGTRQLRALLNKQAESNLDSAELNLLKHLRKEIVPKREKALQSLQKHQEFYQEYMELASRLFSIGLKRLDKKSVERLVVNSKNPQQVQDRNQMLEHFENNVTAERLKDAIAKYREEAHIYYNYLSDPVQSIVGDNASDLSERFYGNNDVIGPDPSHATHISGIIAAVRDNNIGIKGVVDNVKIMPIRILGRGDERDKDVANAIVYAVDNGAKVINLSFGKYQSYHQHIVDQAIAYAASKNVLIIKSAGNDGEDTDQMPHFPRPISAEGKRHLNMLVVTASDSNPGRQMVARFGNYGQRTVDLMAPGVMIKSTIANNQYGHISGTSMAAPMVSGLAALLLSYKPELSYRENRDFILQSVVRFPGVTVFKPGRELFLSEICRSGGVVNAFEAVSALFTKYPIPTVASRW